MNINKTERRKKTIQVLLLAFLVIFSLCVVLHFSMVIMFYNGIVRYRSTTYAHPPKEGSTVVYLDDVAKKYRDNRLSTIVELYLRTLIPAPWRSECYSNDVTVCELMDFPPYSPHEKNWGVWILFISVPGLASLASGLAIWLGNRKKKENLPIDDPHHRM